MIRQSQSTASSLLVRYGPSVDSDAGLLGVVYFGDQPESSVDGLPQPFVHLQPLAGATREVWTTNRPVQRGNERRITWAATEDVLFAAVDPRPENGSLEAAAHDAYAEMLQFVHESGYRHFLRVWNHVPHINEEPEGLERYRRFSIGRHRAFERFQYELAGDLPAASAVGSHSGELTIYFLASTEPGHQIENPRQVSAFAYPPEYGPKSPSFSRGCVRRHPTGADIFLSGTASIVGHRSVHEGDLMKQLDETMVNIDTLLRHAGETNSLGTIRLENLTSLKIYLRDAHDREAIDASLAPRLSSECSLLYVEADICRRELLLEIEGVAQTFA